MPRLLTTLTILLLCTLNATAAADTVPAAAVQEAVDNLEEPLYSPFIERYVLDELKQLRTDMGAQRAEFIQMTVDREHSAVDRAVTYATDTITYFFYLIAAASSILVLVGWTSIREIKERVHSLADEEINRLIKQYEARLESIEQQLSQKSQHIEENREQIETTNEVQSLWLRTGQETNITKKILIYDQILGVRPEDCEALTYKADAVLELGEPQWASNLCHQALRIDPENTHAFYQLACANTVMGHLDEAVHYLGDVLQQTESYRQDIIDDPVLLPLHDLESFQVLLGLYTDNEKAG